MTPGERARRALLLSSLAALVTLAIGCSPGHGGGGPGATGTLVVTGASTLAPLMSDVAKAFESRNPGARIDVQAGGSSRGIADVRQGVAHVGMVSRALKPDEQDLRGFAVAHDGICVIVHRDNPVPALTDEQVVGIYTGKLRGWGEVGGPDRPITVINKAEGRSTLELFLHHFHIKATDVKAHVVIGDNEQGIKTVEGNPAAIGYVSIGTAEYSATHGGAIRLLPVSGIAPSTENVRNGSFPIARPLLLVTAAEPQGLAKAFIDFSLSPQVSDIVKEHYFVRVQD